MMPSLQLICAQQHLFLFLTLSVCRVLCLCHLQLSFDLLGRLQCSSQPCCHSIPDPFLSSSAPSAPFLLGPCLCGSRIFNFSTSLPGTVVSKPSLAAPSSEVPLLSFNFHPSSCFPTHYAPLQCLVLMDMTPSHFQNSCSHCNQTYPCGPSRVFTDYRNDQRSVREVMCQFCAEIILCCAIRHCHDLRCPTMVVYFQPGSRKEWSTEQECR